ncbi:hypothetical protein JCGZ_03434 [Jatropha curcas]|uniref:non-specific serine/threonine protein kinase n=1 Tax=Jatropha curcas TaxID=180498 RepID=A0A067KY43_JATCU|nr:L-type lectin-domain containing receptor kinase V.9 [Jatropha curcas]KDP39903.1 hypothetical protein JCGZ_03434 [Jatropha curcas]
MCGIIFMLVMFNYLAFSGGNILDEFSFNGQLLQQDGGADLNSSNGLIKLTNDTSRIKGHVFYYNPIRFKNSSNSSLVSSFSTTFIFAIVPEYPKLGGHGFAFAISPSKEIPDGLPSQYLGLFNSANVGNDSNHIVAVEFDTVQDFEFGDINDNHVGIDINSLESVTAAPAGYYADNKFIEIDLASAKPLQVWVEYDGVDKILNVTIHPIHIKKPKLPLLSLNKDLSLYLYDHMYVGFSSSSGLLSSSHYILGWSFKMNGQAQDFDISHLPKVPGVGIEEGRYRKIQKMLAVILSLIGGTFLLILIFGVVLIYRKKKLIQVLEDWEVLYGPHRFTYKDLFTAAKGFKEKQLLGKGGFGRVYKGVLPSSNAQIAVKRISHESKQGMREFVAEIATIGRLRHPNLVRLLGYCRRKSQLYLVYDYMPNGSLDKFLYGQPNFILDWSQRFNIIKNVASALFYLHQQWVQVIIHRDIKPANVLLDNEMNARLGDFGLAKLCDHGFDPQTTRIAGTLGYIAPELARSGKASTATDIFAFGVFMLEIVCGRRPVNPRASSPEEIILMDWVMDCWDKGDILETVDYRIEKGYVIDEVELVLKLGLLCSHAVAAVRPSMASVMQFLDGVAPLPDNLSSIIKSREFNDVSTNEAGEPVDVSIEEISIPSITLTESFASHGR